MKAGNDKRTITPVTIRYSAARSSRRLLRYRSAIRGAKEALIACMKIIANRVKRVATW